MFNKRLITAGVAVAAVALTLSGCSGTAGSQKSDEPGGVDASTATSVDVFGGIDGLAAAAKKEGTLNIIATPVDWANYGEIFKSFEDKYGVKIVSSQDQASSQVEIDTAKNLDGQDIAPDVFDIGSSVAVANTKWFAPYKPTGWGDVADNLKESTGLWHVGYYGLMSVGYDTNKIKTPPTSVDDLMGSEYKGAIALNGNPTQSTSAQGAIMYLGINNGGSTQDITPGLEFVKKLKAVGNWNSADGKPDTIASGEVPVILDWSFNQLGFAESPAIKSGGVDWKYVVLPGTGYAGYYNQAINVHAPHPAAARLWQEYLYTDAAQAMWLKGGAFPVRLDAMLKDGSVKEADLPGKPDKVESMTTDEATKAGDVLNNNWADIIG